MSNMKAVEGLRNPLGHQSSQAKICDILILISSTFIIYEYFLHTFCENFGGESTIKYLYKMD